MFRESKAPIPVPQRNSKPALDKQVVLVTNGGVGDPFLAFDRYDDRSLIEYNLFRDAKHNWCLEQPPGKTKEGVWVQVYVVMAMKALTTSFLMWQEEQARLHDAGEQTSWSMYRRKLKTLNRNKLILFVDSSFGIFFSHEVFMLAGVHVRDAEKDLNITRAQIHTNTRASPLPTPPEARLSYHFAALSIAKFLISEFQE